jgi:N-acetylmuramoyl-L-alanine amidase
VLVESLAAALICLDPGHATEPAWARGREPIGPGSRTLKIRDGGGTPGEAAVALAIARATRTELLRRGYRVALTRDRTPFRGGNRERARFCNARGSALMLRIHADGAADPRSQGVSTLMPARLPGWTDDIHAPSVRAGKALQRALVRATGARDLGVVERSDLTGFNWADVPAVLVETGFMTNPRERRLLRTAAYRSRIARGLAAGVAAFTAPR